MNPSKPAYACVPYYGGTWSLVFHRTRNSSGYQQGYGEFPRDRFPGVPVVRFDLAPSSAVVFEATKLAQPAETTIPDPWGLSARQPLAAYLAALRELGIPVEA